VTTFERLDIERQHAPNEEEDHVLLGRAGRRTIRMTFEAVTEVLTRVQVTVSHSLLLKDLATAEEILSQLEATTDRIGASAKRRRSEGRPAGVSSCVAEVLEASPIEHVTQHLGSGRGLE
jgi:hypothetical protein